MTRLIERVQDLRRVTGGSTNCGWVCDEVAILLYSLVKFHKPDLVIQCGHLWGKSALVCLEAMTDSVALDSQRQEADKVFEKFVDDHTPRPSQQKFISVDPHSEGVPNWQAGIDLLKQWYPTTFEFHKERSQFFFAKFQPYSYHRVITIIDGDHSPEGCRADLEGSARIGAKLIFLDDIDWIEEIYRAGRDFAERHAYAFTPFHIYNGVAILSK